MINSVVVDSTEADNLVKYTNIDTHLLFLSCHILHCKLREANIKFIVLILVLTRIYEKHIEK